MNIKIPLFTLMLLSAFGGAAQNHFLELLDNGYEALAAGNLSTAKQSLEAAVEVMPATYGLQDKAILYNDLGVAYYELGAYKKGVDMYQQSLGIYRKTGNDSLIAGSQLNLGLAYKGIGLYEKAMQELTEAARILEQNGQQKELSSSWNAMGNIQRELGDFGRALGYHKKALAVREQIRYEKGIADSYNNIGSVYLDKKQLDSAEFFLEQSLRLKNKGTEMNRLTTLTLLGQLYLEQGQPQKAYGFLNEAYNLRLEENSAKVASSLFYLGTYYAKTNNRQKALECLGRAEMLAKESENHTLRADVIASEISLMKKSDPLLIEKYRELLRLRELILSEESSKEIARLEIEYDTDRKDKEIRLARKQRRIDAIDIENQQLRNQRLLLGLSGAAVLAIVLLIAWHQARKKKNKIQAQNILLEDQKEEIYHLHHELSHRTKNYFGMLSGILKSDRSNTEDQQIKKVLNENIRRLEAMSLVQHYLLEDSTKRNKHVRLDLYLDNLADTLILYLIPGNKVELTKDFDTIHLDYDISMRVAIVLNELVSNAIEHGLDAAEKPTLLIRLKQKNNQLFLVVKDNGRGFPPSNAEHRSKGIALIRKMLQKIDGTLSYRNDQGCEATVTVKTKSVIS